MAIKGKSKPKSKPRSAPRAPRREVVEVPTPFFLRRWVQVTGALILGILLTMFVVWVGNGLHADSVKNQKKAAAAALTAKQAKQRVAVQTWKGTVDTAIAKIGTAPQGPGNPTVFTALTSAVQGLTQGNAPAGSGKTLKDAQTNAQAAHDALKAVDLVNTIISGKGFDVAAANYLLNSQTKMALGLDLYREAAAVGATALAASGTQRTDLATEANTLLASAAAIFNEGWSDLQQAEGGAGIPVTQVPPSGGIPGLTGGS